MKTTFFCVASWVEKYPESVKALSDAGHEIGNHSTTHPHMPKLSKEQMIKEITNCNEKIKSITNKDTILFRAPYGDYSNNVVEAVNEQNMYIVQWDVDSLDWKNPPSEDIAKRVISKVKNGSIVLFHNAAINTPKALPTILETLQSQGYKIVPISELLLKGDYYTDNEGRMKSKQ